MIFPKKSLLKVLPTYAVGYTQSLLDFPRKQSLLPLLNKHSGTISNKAATKIRNAINWMLYLSEKKKVYSLKERSTFTFYLNFFTLTLTAEQKHSDEQLKELLLVPFLEWMKKTHKNQMYVWKAESQANGNIHFHITAHTFIHWMAVRKKWNTLLAKNGYCKVFQDGTNDKGNAATQVKAAKNPEQLGGYLAAYISKKDTVKLKIKQPKGLPKLISTTKCSDTPLNYCYATHSPLKRPIEGRLWGCSYNLSRINVTVDEEEVTGETFNDILEDTYSMVESQKNEKYYNLLFYRNLKFKKVPSNIEYLIKHEVNLKPQQKYYKVDSFFEQLKTGSTNLIEGAAKKKDKKRAMQAVIECAN